MAKVLQFYMIFCQIRTCGIPIGFFKLLYSLLEPKVETQEGYNTFKVLLFAYINHPNQVAICGTANCDRIITFIRENMVPYDQNAYFYNPIKI